MYQQQQQFNVPGGQSAPPTAYAQVVNFSAPVQNTMLQGVNTTALSLKPHEVIHEGMAREFLSQRKWPPGLQDCFVKNAYKIAYRVFICDDSGSMESTDGSRVIDINGDSYSNRKLIGCSRWAELVDTMKFHATLAHAASTPTEFRLLNSGVPVVIGNDQNGDDAKLNAFMRYLTGSPNSGTPLCRHIREVTAEIKNMEHHLRSTGQKALLVIATDGEASDGNVAEAMRPLKSLPVWVVIRLCTNQSNIVDYWNNVDKELELDMDVLDDLCGEAKTIKSLNSWLTYGEPLHRLREFGCCVKELDLLDEKKLSMEQMRKLCCIIYGGNEDTFPHPEADWNSFVNTVIERNKELTQVWDPNSRKPIPWVNPAKLASSYKRGSGACTIM